MVKHKRVVIYSNAWNANAGGGIAYILAIAKILADTNFNVTVYFYDSVRVDELKSLYGVDNLIIKKVARTPFPFTAQLKYAYKEWMSFDIVILQTLEAPRLTFVKKSFILCDFPMKAVGRLSDRVRLKTWSNIIANSEYTKKWIWNRWGRKALVWYPPINKVVGNNEPKRNDIVCVGRFNKGRRSKRQDVVLECYKELCDEGFFDCKLHFIGYVEDVDFVKFLKQQALGYPVVFHENVSYEVKQEILGKSSIFVSACGYQVEEDKEPMFVEHFGIAVVEAMALGCIPLVTGKGGHKETVDHGVNGYHWFTKEELKLFIIQLNENHDLRSKMSKAAYAKSNQYSFKTLNEKMKQLFCGQHD